MELNLYQHLEPVAPLRAPGSTINLLRDLQLRMSTAVSVENLATFSMRSIFQCLFAIAHYVLPTMDGRLQWIEHSASEHGQHETYKEDFDLHPLHVHCMSETWSSK